MREEENPANFGRRAGKAKRANRNIITKTLLVFGSFMLIGCSDTGVSYEKHSYKSAIENQGGK